MIHVIQIIFLHSNHQHTQTYRIILILSHNICKYLENTLIFFWLKCNIELMLYKRNIKLQFIAKQYYIIYTIINILHC